MKIDAKARFQAAIFVEYVFDAQRHLEKQSFSRCSPEPLPNLQYVSARKLVSQTSPLFECSKFNIFYTYAKI